MLFLIPIDNKRISF